MEDHKNLLLKSAMYYGLIMGIYWVIKYLFFIFGIQHPWLNTLYSLASLAVPFLAYYLTKLYRRDIGGSISFFHAWRFGIMLYFFAALIVSVEHFLFYQFFAPKNFIPDTVQMFIETMNTYKMYISDEAVETLRHADYSAIHLAVQGIFNNIFFGIVLSIPVAALLSNNNVTGTILEENKEEKQ